MLNCAFGAAVIPVASPAVSPDDPEKTPVLRDCFVPAKFTTEVNAGRLFPALSMGLNDPDAITVGVDRIDTGKSISFPNAAPVAYA